MARSLAKTFMKGIGSHPIAGSSRIASGYFYHNRMSYSTTAPNDPDTHEDFKPANKLECSSEYLKKVSEDVKGKPVVLYMKGVPEAPQCGFSSLATKVLFQYKVPLFSRNILNNPDLKSAVKAFSNWPTFPQIFINGEFIGGSDIILEMHQSGELAEKLKDIERK